MGIDKKTTPYVNIVLDGSSIYVKSLKDDAKCEFGDNDDMRDKIMVSDDTHSINTEEYYFESSDNALIYNGVLNSSKGETSIYFTIPLSDEVLVDILQHAIKKFNKLKVALESLK